MTVKSAAIIMVFAAAAFVFSNFAAPGIVEPMVSDFVDSSTKQEDWSRTWSFWCTMATLTSTAGAMLYVWGSQTWLPFDKEGRQNHFPYWVMFGVAPLAVTVVGVLLLPAARSGFVAAGIIMAATALLTYWLQTLVASPAATLTRQSVPGGKFLDSLA